jgi:hypothetical protein
MATREVEAMYFLLNITLIYPIFSLKQIVFSYIIFVKSGLTPCTKGLSPSYSDCIFFKIFFTVSKPKATNSIVSDCY